MADNILAPHVGTPPVDSVLLRISAAIERDYVARGVFPELHRCAAAAARASASRHYVSQQVAWQVLGDAASRSEATTGRLRAAYKALRDRVHEAIYEATKRPAMLAAPTATCAARSEHLKVWLGTRRQLEATGIEVRGSWPKEAGGRRSTVAQDSRGFPTLVTRHASAWPGLFEARVHLPRRPQQRATNLRAQLAAADPAFQVLLGALLRPTRSILRDDT